MKEHIKTPLGPLTAKVAAPVKKQREIINRGKPRETTGNTSLAINFLRLFVLCKFNEYSFRDFVGVKATLAFLTKKKVALRSGLISGKVSVI